MLGFAIDYLSDINVTYVLNESDVGVCQKDNQITICIDSRKNRFFSFIFQLQFTVIILY